MEERANRLQADHRCRRRLLEERARQEFLRLSRKLAYPLHYHCQRLRKFLRPSHRQAVLRLQERRQNQMDPHHRQHRRQGWREWRLHQPRQWRQAAIDRAGGDSKVDPPNHPTYDPSATIPSSLRPFLSGQSYEWLHSACHDNKAATNRSWDHIHDETSTPSRPPIHAAGW